MMRALREAVRRSPVAGPIADLATAIQNPALARRLLADARRTRTEMAFARELPPAKADAPLLLILSMTNDLHRQARRHVRVLPCAGAAGACTCSRRRSILNARRIYGAFGINDLLDFEKLVHRRPVSDRVSAPRSTRRATNPMDFRSVMAWTYRDAWIGPQLLSSVSRSRFEGAPDPRDPAVRAAILEQLPTTLGFVHAAEDALSAERPDLILVNEPNYHVLGPFVDVAISTASPRSISSSPRATTASSSSALRDRTRRIHPNSITRDNPRPAPRGAVDANRRARARR